MPPSNSSASRWQPITPIWKTSSPAGLEERHQLPASDEQGERGRSLPAGEALGSAVRPAVHDLDDSAPPAGHLHSAESESGSQVGRGSADDHRVTAGAAAAPEHGN